MTFNFLQLIEHTARTRKLGAGTIIGSGTISNDDRSRGSSCLAEKRMLETIAQGKPVTPWPANDTNDDCWLIFGSPDITRCGVLHHKLDLLEGLHQKCTDGLWSTTR